VAWYREWFGQDYLDLYAHRDQGEAEASVARVVEWLGPERPNAVLDLACGAGRHTQALRKRGLRALGVDLSLTLLAGRPDLPRVRGDMRRLPFAARSFDWVLNFFTSFGYFETERENFRVLEEIVRVLRPGGRFLIDFLNRDRVLAERAPAEASETAEDDGRRIDVQRWYDAATCRINKRITVSPPPGPVPNSRERGRPSPMSVATSSLSWAGRELTALPGNFLGHPFQSHS
jgi:SAM-dependent methyltransferase